jgi:hypothetical protein
VLADARLEIGAEPLVRAQQVVPKKVFLRFELPIQAHFVDAGALYHRLDADVAGALEIKKSLGGVQDLCMRNHARGDRAGLSLPADSHSDARLKKS